jgi:hypothetical protein
MVLGFGIEDSGMVTYWLPLMIQIWGVTPTVVVNS